MKYIIVLIFMMTLSGLSIAGEQEESRKLFTAYHNLEAHAEANSECQSDKDCVALATGMIPCGSGAFFPISNKNFLQFWWAKHLAHQLAKKYSAYQKKYKVEILACRDLEKPIPVCVASMCSFKR